jgi:hypothetical protein
MTQQEMFGQALWLGARECKNTDIFVLRGRFSLSAVRRATLRVLGLGFFHCFINGVRVGEDLFLPLCSEYEPRENFPTNEKLSDFRTYVPEYDVTDLLREGENTITIHFGGGWYTFEQNINEMREGAALLYNNEALPLEGETRVSLFGHASVDPSFQSAAAGTKANDGGLNVINLRQALESKGFAVNPTLWDHLKASTVTRNNVFLILVGG